jgi:hypothetical protein
VLVPLDLMARLAAPVPPSRTHLTRFHGVPAPHSKLRTVPQPYQPELPLGRGRRRRCPVSFNTEGRAFLLADEATGCG